MALTRDLSTPTVATQRAVGAIAIKHANFDHVLRLSVKRMLGLSIRNPIYRLLFHHTMTSKLVRMVSDQLKASTKFTPAQKEQVKRILRDSEELTEMRNTLVHSVWARYPGKEIELIHGGTRHVQPIPSLKALKECGEKIDALRKELDELTQSVFF